VTLVNEELTSPSNVDPTSTTAPPPVTEADPTATLPYLMLDAVPAGFGQPTSVSTSYGKDFEPPAHLLGWHEPGVVGPARVPVVVSSQWMEALPEARDIDSGNVTGWIANISGVTVGSFHVDGMSATVRVESSSIPDADIVALMSGLPPSLEVEWDGGNGPPEAFVEIARQADDAYLHSTTVSTANGDFVSFGAVTDYPINGLTLEGRPTVSQVLVDGQPSFVLRSTTAGVVSATLFWPCGENYRCMLGYSGDHSDPSDSELVALARTRPATAAEIEQFEEM